MRGCSTVVVHQINAYDTMISRIIRGSGWKYLIPNDFEYRFTYEDDNYAWAAYTSGALVRVPFEIWDVTQGVRLTSWFYDYDGNDKWDYMQQTTLVLAHPMTLTQIGITLTYLLI